MKVSVLMGGTSAERDVSLKTGMAVIKACIDLGYTTRPIEFLDDYKSLLPELKNSDIVFNALHGTIGEDGTIQSWLDKNNLPYTGSDSDSSRRCMNKDQSKSIVRENNFLTPDWILIEKKIKLAKPEAKITTPSTAAISALKKLNIKKVSIFTPYLKDLNDEVVEFFKKENFVVTSNSYFGIESDIDIGKVDQDYLYEVLSKIELNDAEALFISCTALPALSIIEKLEKKLNKIVLSSNQALIWDTLEKIGKSDSVKGFGKLFSTN